MEDIIASYLIQNRECTLPLLGNFKITTSTAYLDIADKKMQPPSEEIIYNESEIYNVEGFTAYVSNLDGIPFSEAEERINNWCLNARGQLDTGNTLTFSSIGNLQKNTEGICYVGASFTKKLERSTEMIIVRMGKIITFVNNATSECCSFNHSIA